jgi:hypothetical protein
MAVFAIPSLHPSGLSQDQGTFPISFGVNRSPLVILYTFSTALLHPVAFPGCCMPSPTFYRPTVAPPSLKSSEEILSLLRAKTLPPQPGCILPATSKASLVMSLAKLSSINCTWPI